MKRHEYVLDLRSYPARAETNTAIEMRAPSAGDVEALSVLMDDAYRGTIDHGGETLEDARREVASYLDGRAQLGYSRVALVDRRIVSACLVTMSERGPLIAYVMTASAFKNRGLAGALLDRTLEALARDAHQKVLAWITDGNRPSESVFHRAGFTRQRSSD